MNRAEFWNLLDRWLEAEVRAERFRHEADVLKSAVSHEVANHYPLGEQG